MVGCSPGVLALFACLVGCSGGDDGDPTRTDTDPPDTDPPPTDPPATEPAATEPPVTDPPATGDIDGDGRTDARDISALLDGWGACP